VSDVDRVGEREGELVRMKEDLNWLHLASWFVVPAIIMYLVGVPKALIGVILTAQFAFLTVFTIFKVLFVEAEP